MDNSHKAAYKTARNIRNGLGPTFDTVNVTNGFHPLWMAICAGVAAGIHPSYQAACSAMVRLSRTYQPNRGLADLYRKKYSRYKQVLDAMAPAWSPLAWPPQ